MKEIASQFFKIWKEIKPLQKLVAVAILLFVSTVLGYLVLKSMAGQQAAKKVAREEAQLLDLAATNALRNDQRKGFELFDTNTWIKGDKELQVLEMRALKGQLEKDLADFDQIKSARVILDISPGRSFGNTSYKTKASVILTLNPAAHLGTSQLRAITNHLAGAVHGLEPHMVAISDTTGKLYKAIDSGGEEEYLSNASLAFEQHLGQKIQALLQVLVGEGHYFSTVQAMVDKGSQHPRSVSVIVAIDQEHGELVKEIEAYLHHMVSGYEMPLYLTVEAIAFEKKKKPWIETKKQGRYGGLIVTSVVVLVALACLYPLMRRYRTQKNDDSLFQVMTRVDVDKLAESIEDEDPQTIALMLSYLEPARAERLIAALPEALQEEILNHLSEIEYESY